MKLLKKIVITAAAMAALSSTAAFANDMTVLIPNNHGGYSAVYRVPMDSAMIGLSINGSGGSSAMGNCTSASCSSACMDRAHGSSAVYKDSPVTFRDNAHGTQVPR